MCVFSFAFSRLCPVPSSFVSYPFLVSDLLLWFAPSCMFVSRLLSFLVGCMQYVVPSCCVFSPCFLSPFYLDLSLLVLFGCILLLCLVTFPCVLSRHLVPHLVFWCLTSSFGASPRLFVPCEFFMYTINITWLVIQ